MASPAASEGDIVVAVTCRCGTVWVRETAVRTWQCRCLRKTIGVRRKLKARGAL